MDNKTKKLCIRALMGERDKLHDGLVQSADAFGSARAGWQARKEIGEWVVAQNIGKMGAGWLFTKDSESMRDSALSSYEATQHMIKGRIAELDKAILDLMESLSP